MKSLFVLLLSLIMCSLMYSQDSSSNHNYALSFGILQDFRVDKFFMDIAVKKIFDNGNQLRLFLSPRVSTRNEEGKTSGSIETSEVKSTDYSLGIGADYLWILIDNEEIRMFGGTGLIFTYGINNNSKFTHIDENGNKSITERNGPFSETGVRAVLGVEWMVNQNIGIHSEYLLTGIYLSDKYEIKSSLNGVSNPTETTRTRMIYLNTLVLFGVSIYL